MGNKKFASELFEGMKGMNRVFQSAATVQSILEDNLIEKAAEAGLRSVFIGFETFSPENLKASNKCQNLQRDYSSAVKRLHELGIMINGSFVFGLDDDDTDVFRRTVDWGIENAITTATYHILTPYPGTRQFQRLEAENRILTRDWSKYDTRTVVYKTRRLTPEQIKNGYDWAYKEFYSWKNILRACGNDQSLKQRISHLMYTGGWKKMEPFWGFLVRTGALNKTLPILETLLSNTK